MKTLLEAWHGRELLARLVTTLRARPWRSPETAGWSDDLSGDEFVQHLQALVGGWLVKGNTAAMDYAIKHMPAGGAVLRVLLPREMRA